MPNQITVSLLINDLYNPEYRQHHIAVDSFGQTLPETHPPYARYDIIFVDRRIHHISKTTRGGGARDTEVVKTAVFEEPFKVHLVDLYMYTYVGDVVDALKRHKQAENPILADLARRLTTKGADFEVTQTATAKHRPTFTGERKIHDLSDHHRREAELRNERARERRQEDRRIYRQRQEDAEAYADKEFEKLLQELASQM